MSQAAGVKVMTGLKVKEVRNFELVATGENGEEVIPCDTVVLSMGVRPRTDVAMQFAGTAKDVVFCGDCAVRAGNITSAVRDGFFAAVNIK